MDNNQPKKRKVCVVIISRANYGRIKSVLSAISKHPDLELQVIAGSSMLLERFGRAVDIVRADGFPISAEIYTAVEGELPITMAKSVGLGIIEIATALSNLKPDVVLTVADRFETVATAIAASYMNIPVAHTQGGEITGSIDESVRHAVTRFAHLHFPATTESAGRLKAMGEEAERIFMTGCPSIDLVANADLSFTEKDKEEIKNKGVGHEIDLLRPYLLLMQHPVTSEHGQGLKQIMETIEAVLKSGVQAIALWPNIDAGSEQISKGIRRFREQNPAAPIRFYKNFHPELYAKILANAACAVGNSSSFIREGSYLGTPAVIVGGRQQGREHGPNAVMGVPYEREKIYTEIMKQLSRGRYAGEIIFGDGSAGVKIAEALSRAPLNLNKRLQI